MSAIVITGGAQRFGYALALALKEKYDQIVISYRSEHHNLDALHAAGIDCIQADFSLAAGVEAFAAQLAEHYPAIRALIHNASDWIPESDEVDPAEVIQQNWQIHVQAPYLLNLRLQQALQRHHLNTGDAADIIHMTDWVACRGSRKHIAYAASKAGLENLTLSFASMLAPAVKVNSIAPALLMFRPEDDAQYRDRVRKKSLLAPGPGAEEGIQAVSMLLESRYITGRSIPLDGGRHLLAG